MEAAGDELSFGNKSIFMVQVKQDQEFGVDQAEFGSRVKTKNRIFHEFIR